MTSTASRNLPVIGTLLEAWKLVKGTKWAIWAPILTILFIYLVTTLLGFGVGAIVHHYFPYNRFAYGLLVVAGIVALVFILYLLLGFFCGILKIVIERGRGNSVTGKTAFRYFSRTGYFFLIMLCTIPLFIPQFIFSWLSHSTTPPNRMFQIFSLVYGLCVGPFLFLAFPLVVDKINSPFKAIALSFRIGYRNWFRLLLITILLQIIMIVSFLIPIGISTLFHNIHAITILMRIVMFLICIWLFPFIYLITGVVYHRLVD